MGIFGSYSPLNSLTIPLFVGEAWLPDGSASNLAPVLVQQKSSAAAQTPYWPEAQFSHGSLQQCGWQRSLPLDYSANPNLLCAFKMTTNAAANVRLEARIAKYTPGTDVTNYGAVAFAAANDVTVAVHTAAVGAVGLATIPLTVNGGMVGGDVINIYFARLGSDGADTSLGVLQAIMFWLRYSPK